MSIGVIVIIIIVLIFLVWLNSSAKKSLKHEREQISQNLKNATLSLRYLDGIPSFKTNSRVVIELLPTEMQLTHLDGTSASLQYNQVLDIGKDYYKCNKT